MAKEIPNLQLFICRIMAKTATKPQTKHAGRMILSIAVHKKLILAIRPWSKQKLGNKSLKKSDFVIFLFLFFLID